MAQTDTIRARILSVAESEFRTVGYSHTTMDHLAETLGMSKKTLYEYFRSKEELADEMIANIGASIKEIHEEVMASDLNTVDKLHAIGQRMQACLLTLASVKLMSDLRRNTPQLWQKIKEVRNERIRTLWTSLLAEGMEKGLFRKEVNPELFITVQMAATEKLLDESFLTNNETSVTTARAGLKDLLLNGILTDKGREIESNYH
ncbi:MAG: TetR/AcrR family transcriptional regulator [bacterium]